MPIKVVNNDVQILIDTLRYNVQNSTKTPCILIEKYTCTIIY